MSSHCHFPEVFELLEELTLSDRELFGVLKQFHVSGKKLGIFSSTSIHISDLGMGEDCLK